MFYNIRRLFTTFGVDSRQSQLKMSQKRKTKNQQAENCRIYDTRRGAHKKGSFVAPFTANMRTSPPSSKSSALMFPGMVSDVKGVEHSPQSCRHRNAAHVRRKYDAEARIQTYQTANHTVVTPAYFFEPSRRMPNNFFGNIQALLHPRTAANRAEPVPVGRANHMLTPIRGCKWSVADITKPHVSRR